MPLSSIWQNLRPWNNSLNTAFEELCCQLAGAESHPDDAIFIRKAAPDAGIECYWKLPNGEEWGWQAEFFTTKPVSSQWQQLDDSVKMALEKHPRLTRYVVCIPLDREDPRIVDRDGNQQEWFMDAWNKRAEKWEALAADRSMDVKFVYWGDHEIFGRLSREEHSGRRMFWFNENLFSRQWFDNRLSERIADAGERYTPLLNVNLPIAKLFDRLGRTPAFFYRMAKYYGAIKRERDDCFPGENYPPLQAAYKTLDQVLSRLFLLMLKIRPEHVQSFPLVV